MRHNQRLMEGGRCSFFFFFLHFQSDGVDEFQACHSMHEEKNGLGKGVSSHTYSGGYYWNTLENHKYPPTPFFHFCASFFFSCVSSCNTDDF